MTTPPEEATDKQDRPSDLVDDAGEVGGIFGNTTQRIGGGEGGDAGRLQLADHGAPAGGIGERAMDEDNGRRTAGGRKASGIDWAIMVPFCDPAGEAEAARARRHHGGGASGDA